MNDIEEIRARHEDTSGGWMHGYYDIDDGEQAHADRAALLRALDAMVKENAELTAVFVAQWGADMRAKQRWQIATGKEGTWPDRANLVVWLLERVEKLEAALDEAQSENAMLRKAILELAELANQVNRAALNQEPLPPAPGSFIDDPFNRAVLGLPLESTPAASGSPSEAVRALTYIESLLAQADPELFECACKGGEASELLPVDLGELFIVSNALRAALKEPGQ